MAKPAGVLDASYHTYRQTKRGYRYRLKRRTSEVEGAIRRYFPGNPRTVLDVGTADGAVIDAICATFNPETAVGVEYAEELLACVNPVSVARFVRANAMSLPFPNSFFDVIIATAVIEHVPSPAGMLKECARVLCPGGMIVITTPDPLMEHVASMIGLLEEEDHNETIDLDKLEHMAEAVELAVLERRKFMFSPVGFPAERIIERVFGPFGLTFFMANQLLVAQKPSKAGTAPSPK